MKSFKSSYLLFCFIFLSISFSFSQENNSDVIVEWPEFIVSDVNSEIKIVNNGSANIRLLKNGEDVKLIHSHPYSTALVNITQHTDFAILVDDVILYEKSFRPIPLWFSILPPLMAILLALIFREVIVSLFLGIFLGTLIPAIYMGGLSGVFSAFLTIIDKYIVNAVYNKSHISVILFSMIIGATVSLISKNGGMSGVVNRLSKYAKTRRSGQLVTWFLGILIFFDDYANTLIVGNTMRPITDSLKISREKLSYIVDSTAAPVAAIAFVTTWIGAELGYIEDGIHAISGLNESVYTIFLKSLQYSFYPIFTLIFIAMLVWMKRDYGPMLTAERKTVNGDNSHELINVTDQEMKDFEPSEKTTKRSYNAIIPVLTIIFVTIAGLLYTGWNQLVWDDTSIGLIRKISDTIGHADAYTALLWSSISGLAVASILTLSQRIMGIQEMIGSVMKGFKTMLTAMIILILAWSLSAVTEDLHTAAFLTDLISGNFSPYALPLATFILSSLVSFSTGSSWGTMAILYPMMLPLTWSITMDSGFDTAESLAIFYNVVSSVLAGSVLGDHCSPISDTTILSSLASSCNHISHVRTQLPYALTVGGIAIVVGTIPGSFGVPFYISMVAGIGVMYLVIRKFGKEI